MPGEKKAPAPVAQTRKAIDTLTSTVTRLQAKLDEAQQRADELHHKAERLHKAMDNLKPSQAQPVISQGLKRSRVKISNA